jgi:hypothetical protein
MQKFSTIIAALVVAVLAACGPAVSEVHNLTPDETRRAQINAEAYFNQERPAGVDTSGQLLKKKGSFLSCRPQDSNSNNLVTCTGMIPNMQGQFTQATMYCGYNTGSEAILGCNDKDQK